MTTNLSKKSGPYLPASFASFIAKFPLKTHPRIPLPPNAYRPVQSATLWLSPPQDYTLNGGSTNGTGENITSLLSADVECLKWQAYIALRGLKSVRVRFDVSPDGALEGRLPNLHVPLSESVLPKEEAEGPKKDSPKKEEQDGELLAAQMIPTWVDAKLGVDSSTDENEGYTDESARDESRAWVSLLEDAVHAALILAQPKPSYLHTLLYPPAKSEAHHPLASLLTPPPAPLTGYFSLLPPWGTRISRGAVMTQYREAIAALSERLGTDKWFLGSTDPTPLDALAFAYLHCILHSSDSIRIEVTKRVNLVAWEWRVRGIVRAAFTQ